MEHIRNHPTVDGADAFPVLPSVAHVVHQARQVSLNPEPLLAAVTEWSHLLQPPSAWHHPCHYFDDTAQSVRWIFMLDLLNHCFWPDPEAPVWTVSYRGQSRSGYWGLAASLKRAMENGVPITDAEYLAGITAEQLQDIFAGSGSIPLFEERLANLHEAGRVLMADWQGDVVHLLEEAGGSAVRLVVLVAKTFPSFRDEAVYRGSTVYFWKRAQIFAADLHLAFGGRRWGNLNDIERLTAFADYKLPQVLREFGALVYAPQLAARVDCKEMLQPMSEEEVEIRALTIWAVEALRKVFLREGKRITSFQVDNWLWQLGQMDRFRGRPYHRCRTIFY